MDPPPIAEKKPRSRQVRTFDLRILRSTSQVHLSIPQTHTPSTSYRTTPRSNRSAESVNSQKRSNDHSDSLIEATRKNDINVLQKIMSDPEKNLNHQDKWGNTALHHAVLLGNVDALMFLIKNPCVRYYIKNGDQRLSIHLIPNIETKIAMYTTLMIRSNVESFVHALLKTDRSFITEDLPRTMISAKIYKAQQKLLIFNQKQDKIQDLCDEWPDYATNDFIIAMIEYHKEHNHENILQFITNFSQQYPDKNKQDNIGNTLLHYTVILKDVDWTKKLLQDPAINTQIRNFDNKNAHQLLSTANKAHAPLREMLFAHGNLDYAIHKEACVLLMSEPTKIAFIIKDPCIKKSLKEIKIKLDSIESAQSKDRQLPQSVDLPKYVNKEFIFEKLIHHLTSQKQTPVPWIYKEEK